MFRTIKRLILPNPLDWMLKRAARKKKTKILIGWNRGLGDIALGLYAMVHRIREFLPGAEITFLTRENLADGFTMLDGVRFLIAPDWKRGQNYSVPEMLKKEFDLVIERPSPTDWVRWQRGKLVPKLLWNPAHEELWKNFDLPDGFTYICIQPVAETNYGLWRNWPLAKWHELLMRLERFPKVKVILFGFGDEPKFPYSNVIDLRGKTTLFQLLSIVKNRADAVILPDSGILSMIYYLDVSFPIKVLSLWADPNHGILKQAVASPNSQLVHYPLIGKERDLSHVSVSLVIDCMFPAKPLEACQVATSSGPIGKIGVILLAGGQGSRLGASGPKGMFCIREKSLFQWILEKVPGDVPVAIMTSPLNHAETVHFFENNQSFGRDVHFFQQELLPMVSKKGEPLPILAPNGNGSVFKSFAGSGLLALFESQGIDLISLVPVENLLADPADPQFISFMRKNELTAGVKCIERKEGDAPMGALVERMGRLEIIEYTEIKQPYRYSYIGMMAMELGFLKNMAGIELPLHWVWKKAGDSFAWKGERFIFDALVYAERASALSFPRGQVYAPLKTEANFKEILSILK